VTTIEELKDIIDHTRSLSNRDEKIKYLDQQNRDILNFLSGNIKKDGIAKAIANEISISSKSISDMEDIILKFEEASITSRRKDKIRYMKSIRLTKDDCEFILTCLYGSLKIGVKIPLPDPIFGETIKPMLCGTGVEFNVNEYIIEKKFDGIRCVATNNNGVITLQSRNGKTLNVPIISKFLKESIPSGVTVDGEIVALDGQFQSLNRKSNNLIYQIFDILFFEYQPAIYDLNIRKIFLDHYITENKYIKISQELDLKSMDEINNWITKTGSEGIVAKDPNSLYIYNDRKNWIKVKHFLDISCEVIGYTDGEGRRSGTIGAINVIPDGFTEITKVGSGFTDTDLDEMKQLIDGNKKITVDVKYQEFTDDNKSLRFPIFLRIREIDGVEI